MNTKIVSVAISIIVIVFSVQLVNSDSSADATNTDSIVVHTVTGQVRGRKALTLFENKPYYSFKGIPYARPPLGDLRFKVSVFD